MKTLIRAAFAATTVALASQAYAGIVITTPGGASVGVQDGGALGFGGVGISFAGNGDGITPGCLCEGWGASGNGTYGQSGNDNGGNVNITILPFVAGPNSGVSTVQVGGGPLVEQAYGLSTSQYLVRDQVTLTNNTLATMTDVRYTRSMDWDIPPTTFRELVTLQRGGSTMLLYSSDNGFGAPNPLSNPGPINPGTENADFTDNGPTDHGAFFTFGFGDLAAGASTTFSIYYGAAPSEAAAFAALGTVGAEVYSFGQQAGDGAGGTPATYIFAFSGVGGTAVPPSGVPEPTSLALMLTAFGIAGAMTRKARRGNTQA